VRTLLARLEPGRWGRGGGGPGAHDPDALGQCGRDRDAGGPDARGQGASGQGTHDHGARGPDAAVRRVLECAGDLTEDVSSVLENEGIPAGAAQVRTVLDFCYQGQNHEIPVAAGPLRFGEDLWEAVERFHRRHHELNGYRLDGTPLRRHLPGTGETRPRRHGRGSG